MLLLFACALQPAIVVDWCLEQECAACTSDAECVLEGNPCESVVYCAQVDAKISVTEIGCAAAVEYDWPAPETCGCDDGVCRTASE